MNLKKWLFSLSFLLAGTVSEAGQLLGNSCLDLYLGPTIGTSIIDGKSYSVGPTDHHFRKVGLHGFLAGGVLGIQYKRFCHEALYLGAQMNLLGNTLNGVTGTSTVGGMSVNNLIIKVKNNFQYGIDGRLGINYNHFTPYVLAGIQTVRWDLTLQNDSTASVRGVPGNAKRQFSREQVGPKIGFGVLLPLACNLNLNIEYNYTFFRKFRETLLEAGTEWHNDKIFRQNAVILGLNWLF